MTKKNDRIVSAKAGAAKSKRRRSPAAHAINTKRKIDRAERFDAKLPAAQKRHFEKAAELGSYRSLSDFVISSAQEKADEIVQKHETLLMTERDREVFFNALLNPPAPNERLRKAMAQYLQSNANS